MYLQLFSLSLYFLTILLHQLRIKRSLVNDADEAVPLKLGIGALGQKTRMMVLPGRERSLRISSAVWIQYMNVTDGRTDGHWAKQRPRLRIASRGKKGRCFF